jgi:hypothetical protein
MTSVIYSYHKKLKFQLIDRFIGKRSYPQRKNNTRNAAVFQTFAD